MNIYEAIQSRKRGALIKHSHFYSLYDKHFSEYQNENIKLLSIGVFNAGDLYMWRKYFPKAEIIVGIDIDPYCKRFEDLEDNIVVEIGDQSNVDFLTDINIKYGSFDIIIDDGGHENNQIITSFQTLFPLLNNEGIYVVEDTYHSYWLDYNCDRNESTKLYNNFGDVVKGGKPLNIIKKKSEMTSMDFLKSLTDKMNSAAYLSGSKESHDAGANKVFREPDQYENSIYSMNFYDNICFIKKLIRNGCESYSKSEWIPHNAEIPDDPNYE
jgi:hypothetical protein